MSKEYSFTKRFEIDFQEDGELDITFTYSKGCGQTSTTPYEYPEIEIKSITQIDVDIIDDIDSDDTLWQDIEVACWEHLEQLEKNCE